MPLTRAQRLAYPLFAIEQAITAGNNFGGVAPADNPDFDEDTFTLRHAAGSVGGLFNPGYYGAAEAGAGEPVSRTLEVEVCGLEIDFGGQSSWTLHVASGGGATDVLWKSGTTEGDLVAHGEDQVKLLLPGQFLKLTTVGAGSAMRARVLFRLPEANR